MEQIVRAVFSSVRSVILTLLGFLLAGIAFIVFLKRLSDYMNGSSIEPYVVFGLVVIGGCVALMSGIKQAKGGAAFLGASIKNNAWKWVVAACVVIAFFQYVSTNKVVWTTPHVFPNCHPNKFLYHFGAFPADAINPGAACPTNVSLPQGRCVMEADMNGAVGGPFGTCPQAISNMGMPNMEKMWAYGTPFDAYVEILPTQ